LALGRGVCVATLYATQYDKNVTSGWSKFALWWKKKVGNNQPIGFHQSIFKHQLKADDHGDDEL
jgi:hypothetical protein